MNIPIEKTKGRVYTPVHIVRNILDLSGYRGEGILAKHVIDNSCGDGAFLAEIVRRYCKQADLAHYSRKRLARDLETYIHGIEIDPDELRKALERVSSAVSEFGLGNIAWDIHQDDTLTVHRYDGQMDFVLGNPPYVRVHNLADTYDAIKRFSFSQGGMTDLFLVFYEIGLNMLKPNGVLGYITPSSFFHSKAGTALRQHLVEHRLIESAVDLKHYQPFEAATYTTIMVLRKGEEHRKTAYYEYDPDRRTPRLVSRLSYEDFCLGGDFYFGRKDSLAKLAKILSINSKCAEPDVKNGFATLLDSFFIGHFPFSELTIPVVKASTGQWAACLFPYDRAGRLIPYSVIAKSPAAGYFAEHETRLRARSITNPNEWYGFGRTQGIKDVYRKKYSVCSIIRSAEDLKITLCGSGSGVYGGLYILTDLPQKQISNVLLTDDFMDYISLLGKYKSGGYYTFSSKDLKRYLCYKLAEEGHIVHKQQRLFDCG